MTSVKTHFKQLTRGSHVLFIVIHLIQFSPSKQASVLFASNDSRDHRCPPQCVILDHSRDELYRKNKKLLSVKNCHILQFLHQMFNVAASQT